MTASPGDISVLRSTGLANCAKKSMHASVYLPPDGHIVQHFCNWCCNLSKCCRSVHFFQRNESEHVVLPIIIIWRSVRWISGALNEHYLKFWALNRALNAEKTRDAQSTKSKFYEHYVIGPTGNASIPLPPFSFATATLRVPLCRASSGIASEKLELARSSADLLLSLTNSSIIPQNVVRASSTRTTIVLLGTTPGQRAVHCISKYVLVFFLETLQNLRARWC